MVQADAEKVRAVLHGLDEPSELPMGASEWPHADRFKELSSKLLQARESLRSEIEAAIARYADAVQNATEADSAWPEIREQLQTAEAKFLDACQAKGVQPADVSKLQEVDRQRAAKQAELDAKQKQLTALHQRTASLAPALAKLHGIWRQQFDARRTACDSIQNATTLVSAGFMLDAQAFESIWERLSPRDSRTRLGKNWVEIGSDLFSAFAKTPAAASPWETLVTWLSAPEGIPQGSPAASLRSDLAKHLDTPDVRAVWEKVRLTRVDDLIDVELKRPDGTSAGRMSGEGGKVLSEGQRNTALLSLILAEGSGPIVIDQPEDELDSNYIFSDLVPLLRQTKNTRQLILATHNANLPVNADAELIYAFDAQDGRGRKRSEGGLDRADVTRAVLDIMEGSEKAFKQRSEKYHF